MVKRQSILFGVGCEPTAAYRIGIEAETLAKEYSVEVLGFRWSHFPITDELRGENIYVTRVDYDVRPRIAVRALSAFIRRALIRGCYRATLVAIMLLIVSMGLCAMAGFANAYRAFLRYLAYLWRLVHETRRLIRQTLLKVIRNSVLLTERLSPSLFVVVRRFCYLLIARSFFFRSVCNLLGICQTDLPSPKPPLSSACANAIRTDHNSRSVNVTFESPDIRSSVPFSQAFRFVSTNLMRNACLFAHWINREPAPCIICVKDFDALLFGAAVKCLTGASLIYSCYEYFPHNMHGMTRLRTIAFKAIERPLAKYADAVITVSPQAAALIQADYGLHTVYWFPNADRRTEVIAAPRGRAQSENFVASTAGRRLKFLYQGAVAPERGVETLLRAWAGVDPEKACLFLRIPMNKYRQACEEIAISLGTLGRSVFFLDTIKKPKEPLAESLAALQEFDAGIIPYLTTCHNYKIACPRKLSHYLHSGRMILANRIDFVQQVVTEAACGLVYDARQPDTLVEAVHRCADNRALVEDMKHNATAYANQHYSWENYEQKFLGIFRAITAEPQCQRVCAVVDQRASA